MSNPSPGKCRLILFVTVETDKGAVESQYAVRFLESDPRVGKPAWRLTKPDGLTYDVLLTDRGPSCECQDFVYRRANDEHGCKHIRALRATGLLSPVVRGE